MSSEKNRSDNGMITAIIGGGKGCEAVLKFVRSDRLGRFRMNVKGVADTDPEAPGLQYARELGIHTTTDFRELFDVSGLRLVLELTGNDQVRDEVEKNRPRNVRFIDHFAARLFWELSRIEQELEKQRFELEQREVAEQERIGRIYDSLPDEILVVDRDMIVQHANQTFLRKNDLSLDEVVGEYCYEISQHIRGDCQVALENCPFFEVMHTNTPKTIIRKHFDSEGNTRYASIGAAPLTDIDGEVTGMIEMTRDITHRIHLEEELKATEVQLRQFMEMSPLATYVKSRQGIYIEANPAACQLLGKDKAEIIGHTDKELLPKNVAEVFMQGDDLAFRKQRQIQYDSEVSLHGSRRYLSTVKYPVLDATGSVTAVGGITRDVTERKKVQLELINTQQYLESILEHSPLAIITTDLQGLVVSFNPGAEDILGHQADDIIGQSAGILFQNKEERAPLVRRAGLGRPVHDYEVNLLHKDQRPIPATISMSVLKDSSGKTIGYVSMCRDISARRNLMNQIIRSERLAAVGKLAAGVAHEINNPLAVIAETNGYLLDLLNGVAIGDDTILKNELAEGLPKISNQVKRCRTITSHLLNFASKREAQITVANVNAAFDEILPLLEKQANLANVKIHRDYADRLPPIQIDEVQFEEILVNLITNAIHALSEQQGGNIWLTAERLGRRLDVSVRDDGPGIPEEVRDTLFDPFVTTKPVGQGTGLGLSICYGIVKRHDGEIRVETKLGVGTRFDVIVPFYRPSTSEWLRVPNDPGKKA